MAGRVQHRRAGAPKGAGVLKGARVRLTSMLAFSLACLGFLAAACTNDTTPDRLPISLHFTRKPLTPPHDSLLPVYPNPFNRIAGDTALTISFAMRDSGSAVVLIQNVIGEEIAGFSDSALAPGTYVGRWNPLASDGTPLRSGLYFVTLHLTQYIDSRLVNVQSND